MNKDLKIREIEPEDNKEVASIIRSSLEDFKANKPGTVYYDESTDHLYEMFRKEKSSYFVVLYKQKIVGGGGVFPTPGLPTDTCELVKLYVSGLVRGKGIGKLLLNKCMDKAMEFGYNKMYLETMPELKIAIPMYEKFGFKYIDAPMGETGHTSCDVWMIKTLH